MVKRIATALGMLGYGFALGVIGFTLWMAFVCGEAWREIRKYPQT